MNDSRERGYSTRLAWLISFSFSAGVAVLVMAAAAGCSTPRHAHESITITGEVTARGNDPFSRYVLETDQQMLYVLDIPADRIEEFSTPARVRVTGRLYKEEWNGTPFAHVEVAEWELDD